MLPFLEDWAGAVLGGPKGLQEAPPHTLARKHQTWFCTQGTEGTGHARIM